MLEEVVVIVYAEDTLDSIWTVDGSVGNVLCGILQKIVNNSLLPQSINRNFRDFYKWYVNERFNDVRRGGRHCLCGRKAWFHLNCGR